MNTQFVLPAAPAPPAAPPAGPSARDASEAKSGASFKEVLAAARPATPEKPTERAALVETTPPAEEAQPAVEAVEDSPLKYALLAALAALATPPVQTLPVVAAPVETTETAETAGPVPAQTAATLLSLQAEALLAPEGQAPVASTPEKTDPAVLFADLLKTQAKPVIEPQVSAAETAETAAGLSAAETGVKPAVVKLPTGKEALAALEALADRLKLDTEKPAVDAEKLAALAITAGSVKAATNGTVAELARLTEARPANGLPLVSQIQQGLETLSKSGQSSLRLQLYPEALGRVDLRLTSSAEGVRVSLTADLSATGNLLQRHAEELRQALTESGLTVAGMSIGFSLGQGKSFNTFDWQPPTGGSAPASGPEMVGELETATGAVLRSLDTGRVDYRI